MSSGCEWVGQLVSQLRLSLQPEEVGDGCRADVARAALWKVCIFIGLEPHLCASLFVSMVVQFLSCQKYGCLEWTLALLCLVIWDFKLNQSLLNLSLILNTYFPTFP